MKIYRTVLSIATVACLLSLLSFGVACGNLQNCLDQKDCSAGQTCSSGLCQTNNALQAASEADLLGLCEASCGWQNRCGEGSKKECTSFCKKSFISGVNPPLQATFVRATTSCFKTLRCGVTDDTCGHQGLLAVDKDYKNSAFVKRCLKAQRKCEDAIPTPPKNGSSLDTSAQTFSNDLCTMGVSFTSTGQAKAEQCFALSCSQVSSCFRKITK